MPRDFYYGLHPCEDRYSMDQVPQQNRGPKGTVEVKGSERAHCKKKKRRFHTQRYCTLNVTIRAVPPQNQKLRRFCF